MFGVMQDTFVRKTRRMYQEINEKTMQDDFEFMSEADMIEAGFSEKTQTATLSLLKIYWMYSERPVVTKKGLVKRSVFFPFVFFEKRGYKDTSLLIVHHRLSEYIQKIYIRTYILYIFIFTLYIYIYIIYIIIYIQSRQANLQPTWLGDFLKAQAQSPSLCSSEGNK